VIPSRPTEMVGASSVPSSFLLAAEMKILAPGLNSLLSAGALGDPRLPDTSFLILPITFEPFDRLRRQIVGEPFPGD
jgi:hypothetical protein